MMAATDYGQSYTDKATQRKMVKFMRVSQRLGKVAPKTKLNSDAKPKHDFFDNPRLQSAAKGRAKGSNLDERDSEKPKAIKARNESQKNNYKPKSKSTGRPKNTSSINRKYK